MGQSDRPGRCQPLQVGPAVLIVLDNRSLKVDPHEGWITLTQGFFCTPKSSQMLPRLWRYNRIRDLGFTEQPHIKLVLPEIISCRKGANVLNINPYLCSP